MGGSFLREETRLEQVRMPELLAPAGDRERLEAAVLYGADAVYLGGQMFGMRASPQNFDGQGLRDAVTYCHGHGVKVYLTCNTLPMVEEVAALPAFIEQADAAGVDALIVADIGVLMLAKRAAPRLDLHISTQTGVVNHLTATELYHLGASRVVLARELTLEQIRVIRRNTPPGLELEAFVHGAMCVSFSGRCLLSNYLTGRDGNRGQCAQPCRWGYHLMEEKRPGLYFPIFEDESGSHILNAQDLCMIEHVDKLAQAGVSSFKLEGRAKSAYYVAVVTNAYRMALELYRKNPAGYAPPAWLADEVRKVSHREYSTGFYFGGDPPGQCYGNRGYVRRWEVVATVDGWRDGHILCTERNRFFSGDELELLQPGVEPVALTVTALLDEEGAPLEQANHPMMKLRIPYPLPVAPGAMLRKAQTESL